jgi:hypothetical protein
MVDIGARNLISWPLLDGLLGFASTGWPERDGFSAIRSAVTSCAIISSNRLFWPWRQQIMWLARNAGRRQSGPDEICKIALLLEQQITTPDLYVIQRGNVVI